jgi:hypothetical protein
MLAISMQLRTETGVDEFSGRSKATPETKKAEL